VENISMRFRPGARLDPSQVQDRRGVGGIGAGGLTIGGGGLGVVGLVIYLVISALSGGSGALSSLDGTSITQQPPSQALGQKCQTGADANTNQDCRIVAVVDSVQKYWRGEFAASGRTYTVVPTVFFTGSTSTGCGAATTDVGPFYCPADKHVYIDLGFFDELRTRLGAQGGPFAQAYVLAHEYGHHVQDLNGVLGRASSQRGAGGGSVRTELQADCLAGVWASLNEQVKSRLEPGDIQDGLNAAAAIGDDMIQRRTQGYVVPDAFTHGSSAQRVKWFRRGLETGQVRACDTFSTPNV
jgi:predicted metalloprotease